MKKYRLAVNCKEDFKIWLIRNNLSINKFAAKCGVSHQYISTIINEKKPVTDKILETFEKGGYSLLLVENKED